eukprot:4429677-Pyramimonas_sp.AAC.1
MQDAAGEPFSGPAARPRRALATRKRRLDVRVTLPRSDLWRGHRWAPRWLRTKQRQLLARP